MSSKPGDLLTLFLGEAEERIEKILSLVGAITEDDKAAERIRRELHALKGAGRMMGLHRISDLCHRGETLAAEPEGESTEQELTSVMDELSAELRRLAQKRENERARPLKPARNRFAGIGRLPDAGGRTIRISSDRFDELSDRAARLRILAVGAGTLVERLRELGHYAEKSVNYGHPQQVLAALATSLRHLALELDAGQHRLLRSAERQLESFLALQLQPLRPFLLKLAQHARELGRTLEKRIEVQLEGEQIELDRRIISALEESLIHVVRNAVDHGLEPESERRKAGKEPVGLLRLRASSEGSSVHLSVSDDGRGVDIKRVLKVARDRGIINNADPVNLTQEETLQLLFQSGFSTSPTTTEISGRGIGLDAVAVAVQGVGGEVWMESIPGLGTTIHLLVPASKRGVRVVVVRVGTYLVALPVALVVTYSKPGSEVEKPLVGRTETVDYGGRDVPVRRLATLLDEPATDAPRVLVFVRAGATMMALAVDAVVDEEEVLLYPLPSVAGPNQMAEFMALLSSGRPVPVLSPLLLSLLPVEQLQVRRSAAGVKRTHLLLIDDSLVTREMMRRLLEDGGFRVVAVASADEALRLLEEHEFQCIVTDIEMPGMSGLELTQRIRQSERWSQLPVVVISTRSRKEDRLAGLNAGADAYITKQGLDARELVRLIKRISA